MQEIAGFPHIRPISGDRHGYDQLETADDTHEEAKTKTTVRGLCFKCGGAVSSAKIRVICDVCRRIVYHAKCVSLVKNNTTGDIDIFCCEGCDKMATDKN